MQEDMEDFVTSMPAAGALFTTLMGDLSQFSVDRFREKIEPYAVGGGDAGPYEGHHALSLRTGARTARPRVYRWPCACAGYPGHDIGAADQDVESVGSRRVPFVVQSEQDKMLRVSFLTHCLNDATGCLASCEGQGPARCVTTVELVGGSGGNCRPGEGQIPNIPVAGGGSSYVRRQ